MFITDETLVYVDANVVINRFNLEVEDNINPSIELIENRQAETDENLIRTTWSREEILSLINLYEEYEKKFKSTTIKNDKVWQEISTKIPSHTWEQCKNKFKYLKSKYIEKKDNMGAKATGAKAIRFDYFDEMEKIFGQHPNVAPVATASSSRGICNITSISSTSCHQEIYASLIPEQKNEKRKAIEEMPEEMKQKKKMKMTPSTDVYRDIENIKERGRNKRHEEKLQVQKELVSVLTDLTNVLKGSK